MLWLLVLYVLAVLAIGFSDLRKTGNFDGYVVAHRKRSGLMVAASMLASVVGASATVSVVAYAGAVGMSAFWWLGSGGFWLIISGLLFAKKLRNLEVYTLPDVIDRTIGPLPRRVAAMIIITAWMGIVGAQFLAAGAIVSAMTGAPAMATLWGAAIAITLYSLLGGQISVMKTDALQIVLLLGGLACCLAILYGRTGVPEGAFHLDLSMSEFAKPSFWTFFLVVGCTYLVGPDVFSRLFTAESPQAARRGAIISGVLLIGISVAIVAIGIWARHFATIPEGEKPLFWIIKNELPGWLTVVMSFGLLSAFISSADTCLLSAASITEHDLLAGSNVKRTRIVMSILALGAAVVASWQKSIFDTLLLAMYLFGSGIVPPVAVALVAWPKRRLHPAFVIAAMTIGGTLGVIGKLHNPWLSVAGFGVSLMLSLIGLVSGKRE
ncbi:MAG: sodium:solute symporter family protein [Candidatus Sumerlaeota bacterium]